MEKEPIHQSEPLTRAQLDDVLEFVKGKFLTARVELRLCVGDFVPQVTALVAKAKLPALLGRPWPPAGQLQPVTYRSASGELTLAPTDLAEAGASYVAPHFYVAEVPRPGELPFPLACYAFIGGKLGSFPGPANDKLLANIALDARERIKNGQPT